MFLGIDKTLYEIGPRFQQSIGENSLVLENPGLESNSLALAWLFCGLARLQLRDNATGRGKTRLSNG
jgi:hypothetical protein